VIAVDVGYGQLAWSLRSDPRVTVLERTNVRDLRPEALPFAPEILVADLSFISLRLAIGALASVAADEAELVLLVKPQFEAGRSAVSAGRGVVRDPAVRAGALRGVGAHLTALGATIMGAMVSPLRGADGNVEFLLHARAPGGPGAVTARLRPDDLEALALEVAP
jgi:23S rRNA (cytidine1920-2'-O)/16S rRNA (cytidine1409-2'-O)-methyltransferase